MQMRLFLIWQALSACGGPVWFCRSLARPPKPIGFAWGQRAGARGLVVVVAPLYSVSYIFMRFSALDYTFPYIIKALPLHTRKVFMRTLPAPVAQALAPFGPALFQPAPSAFAAPDDGDFADLAAFAAEWEFSFSSSPACEFDRVFVSAPTAAILAQAARLAIAAAPLTMPPSDFLVLCDAAIYADKLAAGVAV